MQSIRVGVIGVGHLGYHHARNYACIPGVELVGVADTSAQAVERASGDFKVAAFSTVGALLDAGVNAVSIATPTTMHCETALACLDAGADVLVEKPIAGAIPEAEEMVRLAKAKNRILQVGHIERFNAAVTALFKAIRSPRFIECHRLSPYPMRGQDVSVVLDLMIHDLEIIRAIDPSPVVSLDASGVAVFSSSEDIANARIRFESGCVANITSSRVSLEKMRKIRIFEPDAYMSTDYSEQEVKVYRKRPDAADAPPMEQIIIESLPVEREEPLKRELSSFIDCVRERKRPVVSGEDALEALKLANDVLEFIRSHKA